MRAPSHNPCNPSNFRPSYRAPPSHISTSVNQAQGVFNVFSVFAVFALRLTWAAQKPNHHESRRRRGWRMCKHILKQHCYSYWKLSMKVPWPVMQRKHYRRRHMSMEALTLRGDHKLLIIGNAPSLLLCWRRTEAGRNKTLSGPCPKSLLIKSNHIRKPFVSRPTWQKQNKTTLKKHFPLGQHGWIQEIRRQHSQHSFHLPETSGPGAAGEGAVLWAKEADGQFPQSWSHETRKCTFAPFVLKQDQSW